MKTCPLCGASVPDGSVFCPKCGARVGGGPSDVPPPPAFPDLPDPVAAGGSPAASAGTDYKGKEIKLCSDGKYRWVYEFNMLRNPVIFMTVVKVFLIILAVGLVVMSIGPAFAGQWSIVLEDLKWMSVFAGVLLVLIAVSYLIVSASNRGKYVVVFEMDHDGIIHRQLKEQFDKAKGLSMVGVLAGVVAGSLTTTGANLLAATKDTQVSDFHLVRSVRPYRAFNTIKVNQPFGKNQVYVPSEDFDFVLDYIRSHCPKVRR